MPQLTRGQKVKLADLTSSLQLRAQITAQAAGLTFDFSCFGVDESGKLSDDRFFIFYNQKSSPDGALSLGGDGDFNLDLNRLGTNIKRLVFVATIDGNGSMSMVQSGAFSLSANAQEVARFEFKGADFTSEKAVMIAEIYLKDVWRVAAVGQGFAGGLNAVLKHFGGQEIEEAPAPTPVTVPIPTPIPVAPKVNLGKVTLEKKGEKTAISLVKGGGAQPIQVNLNWDAPPAKRGLFGGLAAAPDLDLGCMFRLKTGEAGVIQPLGKQFGSRDAAPFIFLDKDDRSGAAKDGENLTIFRPDQIDLVTIFAMIYGGAPDFTSVNSRLTLKDPNGNEILVHLSAPERGVGFCVVASIRTVGGQVEFTKEEFYCKGHREADAKFGFGFRWAAGSK